MDGSNQGETAMARRPQPEKPEGTNREKIIGAFMALLAERRLEEISFGDIAGRAGLPLAECRGEFGSPPAGVAAQGKESGPPVLAGGGSGGARGAPAARGRGRREARRARP